MSLKELTNIPLAQVATIAQQNYEKPESDKSRMEEIVQTCLTKYLYAIGHIVRLPDDVDRVDFYRDQRKMIEDVRTNLPKGILDVVGDTLTKVEAEINSWKPKIGTGSGSAILFREGGPAGKRKNHIG